MEWLPTAMYKKAAKWLAKHDLYKAPVVHLCTTERYLVLTTEGMETYGKITKTLRERYMHSTCLRICAQYAQLTA
jgi:hypothetical protein